MNSDIPKYNHQLQVVTLSQMILFQEVSLNEDEEKTISVENLNIFLFSENK